MIKRSLYFWLLLFCSLFIASLLIAFAFKIMKAVFFLLLLAVLTPIIYVLLKSLISSNNPNGRSEKLKSRD
ncbi:hypothetical protein [Adhaeribacter rhizoryzae]|uniref:hypothetical protein n=1 Tax=Adhaeribacter rhizoryzae TaxID=2607907 RepID=UPI0012329E9C|nr:hypothetical protein [Adhaeribacter rhizoryzae]